MLAAAYRWILARLVVHGVLAQRSATIQLYVEFKVVLTGAIDVHAVRIVCISCVWTQTRNIIVCAT